MTPLYHEMSLASRKIRAESRLSSLDFHPDLSKPSTRSRLRTSAVQSSSRSALSQNLPQEAAFLLPLLNLRHGQLLLEISHKKPLAHFRRSISVMIGSLPRGSPQKAARLPPRLPLQSSFQARYAGLGRRVQNEAARGSGQLHWVEIQLPTTRSRSRSAPHRRPQSESCGYEARGRRRVRFHRSGSAVPFPQREGRFRHSSGAQPSAGRDRRAG